MSYVSWPASIPPPSPLLPFLLPFLLPPSHPSPGEFLWHGRDLRAMKRPLFPPMMSLLTCPGNAYMGRGQASLPASSLQHASLPSVLGTLAEDAVRGGGHGGWRVRVG